MIMLLDVLVIFIVILCVVISVTRGFVKELCALMFLLLSVFLTADYYDFFCINYSKYCSSKFTINVLSAVSVFIALNLLFMVINNWIMYMLLPIRLGFIDKATGIFVGVLKGILFSYVLFFGLQLYYYSIHNSTEQTKLKNEAVLPEPIVNSHSYRALFSVTEDIIDTYVPESIIAKIKEINKETNKDDKKKEK